MVNIVNGIDLHQLLLKGVKSRDLPISHVQVSFVWFY